MAIGLAALTANAGPGVFNLLGFGAGIGTGGMPIAAATPITSFVSVRAGVLGGKGGRPDPVAHETDARWHSHALEIAVENP